MKLPAAAAGRSVSTSGTSTVSFLAASLLIIERVWETRKFDRERRKEREREERRENDSRGDVKEGYGRRM